MVVPPALAADYAACERIARRHYENFPVASLLLPRAMRPPVAALYAFARAADDIADEGDLPPDERERLLDQLGSDLETSHFTRSDPAGAGRGQTVQNAITQDLTPILRATRHTIEACRLPVQLFHDLLSAFRQDVRTTRYQTWDEVLDYCRRSANPVGRLVLRIAGYDDPVLDRESDAVCTALQLTNFWQDFAADWRKGRLYLPLDEAAACGAREADLDARRMSPEWRCALGRAGRRTRELFADGRSIADRVRGRLRWELRLTWLGGTRILDRLERSGFDVFAGRPALTAADAPALAWRALAWKKH
jgi:hydroxysqualene synthase